MRQARRVYALTVLITLLLVPAAFAQPRSSGSQSASSSRVDAAFQKFWAADSPAAAGQIAEEIAKTGVNFEEALARLKEGRQYTAQKSGVVFLHNRTPNGMEHNFAVNVPPSYDPAKRYQVRFQLHGGV